ncbi:hypothetical protein BN3590_00660 [Clostridium sp. C105KSO15]|nr:hypothetical protein BN3590_00660 [Clostridium sp. C105KSO15]
MSNKNSEKLFQKTAEDTVNKVRLAGMRAGATGILGAVLNMCNEGKSIDDIKLFCEKSLNLDGMKGDR